MPTRDVATELPGRSTGQFDPSTSVRSHYLSPVVTCWGALVDLTNGGPAAGSDESMTGSTTFGFLFFGTDEWHLFGEANNR